MGALRLAGVVNTREKCYLLFIKLVCIQCFQGEVGERRKFRGLVIF